MDKETLKLSTSALAEQSGVKRAALAYPARTTVSVKKEPSSTLPPALALASLSVAMRALFGTSPSAHALEIVVLHSLLPVMTNSAFATTLTNQAFILSGSPVFS